MVRISGKEIEAENRAIDYAGTNRAAGTATGDNPNAGKLACGDDYTITSYKGSERLHGKKCIRQ